MTILTLQRKELESHIGTITKQKEDQITMFGTPVENISESEVSVEVFPNRPDLLSLEGFSRSFLQYLGKKGIAKFKVEKPEKDYQVKVEKSVKTVRPYTVCAIMKGLKFDDEKIKQIIDIQEKLHNSIGRKRKKIAIGIYPLEKIKLPIRFIAKKPEDIKFIPLEMDKEVNARQILKQHPTGREYAHLLENENVFPIFVDADDRILSMPPIINSSETGKISEKTKDVFIECSGFNLEHQKKCLNMLVTTLSEMQGKIYSMEIVDSEKGHFTTPNLEPEKLEFKIEDINKTLGLELTEKQIKNNLEKMGIGFEKVKDKKSEKTLALIPAYRTDILHWIDLTEEIAIAYGYDNFKPELPKIATIAQENPISKIRKKVQEILSGLGFLEVSSYHLTTKEDIKKMHFDFREFIELENSKTEYNCLRNDLLSNLMKVISENSDSGYPQRIFEIGSVFEKDSSKESKIKESENLSIAITDEKTNFTEIKQTLDYIFKMLDKEYKIEICEDSNYITGRVGNIIVNRKNIGQIGEIAPRVLKNWKIKMPVSALEIDIDWLRLD